MNQNSPKGRSLSTQIWVCNHMRRDPFCYNFIILGFASLTITLYSQYFTNLVFFFDFHIFFSLMLHCILPHKVTWSSSLTFTFFFFNVQLYPTTHSNLQSIHKELVPHITNSNFYHTRCLYLIESIFFNFYQKNHCLFLIQCILTILGKKL